METPRGGLLLGSWLGIATLRGSGINGNLHSKLIQLLKVLKLLLPFGVVELMETKTF